MNRHVLTLDLRDGPGVVEAYRDAHARIWPEVARSLRAAGVLDMDIYLLGRRLVMVLDLAEGLDVAEMYRRHAASGARIHEWEALMQRLQQPAPAAPPGEWWAGMERVFSLASPANAPAAVGPARSS